MDWKSYTILYEDYDSLIRLQEVFKAHEGLSHLEGYPPFTVRQLPSEDDDYRYVRVSHYRIELGSALMYSS